MSSSASAVVRGAAAVAVARAAYLLATRQSGSAGGRTQKEGANFDRKNAPSAKLPREIFDPHHHFFDPQSEETKGFQSFVKGLGVPAYSPEQYAKDTQGLNIIGSTHVEGMTDMKKGAGIGEVLWVDKFVDQGRCKVAAIVASCDMAAPDAPEQLQAIAASSKRVRGIRWILDYDGPFSKDGKNATHISCSRFGKDLLRDPSARKDFERGFAALERLGLSFDLQCAPVQLPAAAAIFSRYPQTRVVIDHMGKPRYLGQDGLRPDGSWTLSDAAKYAEWLSGMKQMAALPNVYVKLSMLGYCVPNWTQDAQKRALLRGMVRTVIDMFGADRCMFASNWHFSGNVSNADCADKADPSATDLYSFFADWVSDMTEQQKYALFCGTARKFYRA